MSLPIQCPYCRTPLASEIFNRPEFARCPSCGSGVQVEVFPAFFRKIASGQNAQALLVEGESSCFYHPQKNAVVPCDACGRFLCALCDCELTGRHLCPGCVESGRSKGKIKNLENHRMRYDAIALMLAFAPLVICPMIYFTIITAPMALFVAIRYWKAPPSLVASTRPRFVMAIILALLEIVGWICFVFFLGSHKHF